jgi:hypothetical protein
LCAGQPCAQIGIPRLNNGQWFHLRCLSGTFAPFRCGSCSCSLLCFCPRLSQRTECLSGTKKVSPTVFSYCGPPDGTPVADGESTQVAKGDHVTSHLRFKFKDGSSYDQTTVFSQRGTFRLMRDHVIQQGPSFKHQMETSIDAPKGEVTVRYTDDHNQEKLTTQHLELPPDLANGILFTLRRTFNRKLPRQPFPMWRPCPSCGSSTWRSFHMARNLSQLVATLTRPCSMQSR